MNTHNENTTVETLFPFVCFYRRKRVEVNAPTSHAAQILAKQAFGAKNGWEISVLRADKTHAADF